MKMLILVFALLIATVSKSQTLPKTFLPPGEPLEYTDVVKAADSTLSDVEMYDRLLKWASASLSSYGEGALLTSDKSAGFLIILIRAPYSVDAIIKKEPATLNGTLIIEVKKGRVRLTFKNFTANTKFTTIPLTAADEIKTGGFYPGIGKPSYREGKTYAEALHASTLDWVKVAIDEPGEDW